MSTLAFILIVVAIVVCVLLGLIVLIQNPKGGGLTSGFASTNNIMGVQRTGDVLEKSTWGFAIALMFLIILINVSIQGGSARGVGDELQNQINAPKTTVPIAPYSGGAAPKDTAKK